MTCKTKIYLFNGYAKFDSIQEMIDNGWWVYGIWKESSSWIVTYKKDD